ncbi:MAG: hypothetical protein PQJ46_16650, partial [Spirochaetales bacterium]|nr:hypothetical protein [Spirochaetales bacterium]
MHNKIMGNLAGTFNFWDLVYAMGIGWGISGIGIILCDKKKNPALASWTIVLLSCIILPLVDHLIKPGAKPVFTWILYITRNINYLLAPLLWMYTVFLPTEKKWHPAKALLHFTPFLLCVSINILFPHLFPIFIVPKANGTPPPAPNLLIILRVNGSILIQIVYSILSLVKIHRHKTIVENYYSSKNTFNTLSWLNLFFYINLLINTFMLLLLLFPGRLGALFAHGISFTIAPLLFLFYFLHYSKKQDVNGNITQDDPKYSKSSL